MTTKTTKAIKTCPVCGHEQDQEKSECIRCGWDFSPLLGTHERVEALHRERLDKAQAAWRQRRYNPDLIPELERDPFETPEEFAARLAERPWYLGVGELRKAEYDIETGRFPLVIRSPQTWARPWIGPGDSYSLCLPRVEARALYQRGAIWPIYAVLTLSGSQVSLTTLVLVSPDSDLPVEIQKTPSLGGRYQDLGNGTVVDTLTGLQWMRCSLGQQWNGRTCRGDAVSCIWSELSARLSAFNQNGGYGGHTDWRVPTIHELKTLIEKITSNSVIDREAFPETPSQRFWSSTPASNASHDAWYVNFGYGYVDDYGKGNARYVRLVRGGK